MNARDYEATIAAHYARSWSSIGRSMRFEKGPISDLPPGFRVLVVPRQEVVVYATVGMSQPDDVDRLELHLLARASQKDVSNFVELLTAVAHYHRTGDRLGLGHTVNFGRPWIGGSACTRGFISLPYLDGPDLEWLANPKVRFLWLIPVTEAEVDYKKKYGSEALEDRFEQEQFDYLDPLRASVA